MIRACEDRDFDTIYAIINKAADKYAGVIPEDRWKVPYMPKEELNHEIESGIVFWGFERNGKLVGVMGIQQVKDVTLIRHAYVHPDKQGQGVGCELLAFLAGQTSRPMLIGTWAAAGWAVPFYSMKNADLRSCRQKKKTNCSKSIGRFPGVRSRRLSFWPTAGGLIFDTTRGDHSG